MTVRLVSQEELPGPLAGYRLIERLGRGGFGEVWKAEAPGGLLKAVKFVFGDLDSADDEGKPAEQEHKALKRVRLIRHPYILSLERFDVIDGQLIIVMELADRNLWDRFRECRSQGLPGIPRAELLGYMAESAEALDLMSERYQIQHLDIKPQNIFLVYNHVKVGDFGLAKMFEGTRGTVTGGVTPVYAAPETFEGYVSRFSDQYSLAIVFQELLTGTRPFDGQTTKRLLMQHIQEPPNLLPLPMTDRHVISRGMAKKPADRWPTCAEMIRALRQTPDGPPPPPAPAPATQVTGAAFTAPHSTPTKPRGAAPTAVAPVENTPPHSTLVTPRLVTPRASANGADPAGTVATAPRRSASPIIPTPGPRERVGEGVLFPALVVGVGQTGLGVLRALRQMVREFFGTPDAVPSLRLLYIDTDPDAVAAATQGADALHQREVILARLNRPAHYLQRDGLPPVEAWLPPGLLYKLPRHAGPAGGVRAFGRLALCDHHKAITQRLRLDLDALRADGLLERTAEATGLGMRSDKPRVYVVAGLAGGTGSGMVVDLAYLVRHELKQLGYRKPDTVGILFVPPADPGTSRPAALANAFATLTEISHYTAGTRYHTRFDTGMPVSDPDGPFARTAVVTLPASGKSRDQRRTIGLAARGLYLDILSPTGRAADDARAAAGTGPTPSAAVFGMYRLSWPRTEVLAAATRRFGERLLRSWTAKESKHLREPIREWLADQWGRQRLNPEAVAARLSDAVAAALKETPEAAFDAAADLIRIATPSGTGRPDPAAVRGVFDQLVGMVGAPDSTDYPGSLAGVLTDATKALAVEADASLSTVTVAFLEQPQYRLAGSEEALAQAQALLRTTIADLEAARPGVADEAAAAFAKLTHLIVSAKATTPDIADALRAYPPARLKQLEADAALSLYRGLLANIPEYLREVSFCRARLGELAAGLAAGADGLAPGPGEVILPDGCADLTAAADLFLAALPEDEVLGFDQELQAKIARRFRAVANVCLKPARGPEFLELLSSEARAFLDARLPVADAATVFLEQRPGPAGVESLKKAYAEAAPVGPTGGGEAAVLAVPPGEAGDAVRAMAAEAVPGVGFAAAESDDDVVVYRERPRVPLAELPALGPAGREAYAAQLKSDDTPPHARVDMVWPS